MLAIIPARGGSKGLPGKNIKLFGGQPLICHTIEAAKSSSLISRIVVSTDDYEIASISSAAGAEVPFLRPSEFASDTSMAMDAYFYTIDNLSLHQNQNINHLLHFYYRSTTIISRY